MRPGLFVLALDRPDARGPVNGTAPEAVTNWGFSRAVATTLRRPSWLRIAGYWYPRGGIPIDVFWQMGKLPKGVWVPDQDVAPYRGRG